MTLLRAAGFSLSFGSRVLFDDLTVVVEEDERVGLVGVNGSGKSTLLRLLAGEMQPDSGDRQLRRGTRITYLPQEPSFLPGATVAGELSVAQAPLRQALAEHQLLGDRLGTLSGSALDRAQALAADDPSLVWLALSIIGTALDGAAAVAAFARLRGPARALMAGAEGSAVRGHHSRYREEHRSPRPVRRMGRAAPSRLA